MKQIAIISFVFFFVHIANAQVSTEELPISFEFDLAVSENSNVHTLSALNMNAIGQEDITDEANGLPPRFGYSHAVNYNLNNSGEWITLANGDKIWMLHIACPDALSINLLYDQFWLPDGAKLFVYSSDRSHVIGAFTSINNKGSQANPQGFATGLIYSDQITVEYYLPHDAINNGIVSVAYVVHGYRYIQLPGLSSENFGDSGNCQVNVNCSEEGANWQNEKDAVALILVNGNRYCTGSLMNTTANDNRPLFLTADHCLGGWGNNYAKYDAINNPTLNHWSFYWHYESPNCNNTSNPPVLSTSGATVVANNPASDFALLQLTENPINKQGVTPYYLGWDWSGNTGTGGVGIHHPEGDVKKIATYNITPVTSNCFNLYSNSVYLPNSNFWKITWMSTTNGYSVTEGGSSGSPLLNNNHHVIGQLFGAGNTNICPNPNCSNPSIDIANYGKLSTSWTSNNASDSRRRLNYWLDPLGTNPNTLDGMAALVPCNTIYINNRTFSPTFLINRPRYISGCTINITNTTINANTTVNINSQQGVTIGPDFWAKQGSNVTITAAQASPSLLSAKAPDDADMLTSLEQAVASPQASGIDFTVYPNPNDGNFTVEIAGNPQPYTVEIFNASGGMLGKVDCDAQAVHINRTDLPAGIYYLKLNMAGHQAAKKLVVK